VKKLRAVSPGNLALHEYEFSFLNLILMVIGWLRSISPVSASSTLPLDEKFEIQEEHRRSNMKKLLTIAGLLAVIATPAFAQSYSHDFGTGNIINEPALEQQAGRADAANSAFAQAPKKHVNRKSSVDTTVDPYSAAVNGGGDDGYNWSLLHDD
jgi:hypothetical protein